MKRYRFVWLEIEMAYADFDRDDVEKLVAQIENIAHHAFDRPAALLAVIEEGEEEEVRRWDAEQHGFTGGGAS